MLRHQQFHSYHEFRREVLSQRNARIADTVEEIADEIYQTQASDEFDSMWDSTDDDG